MKRIRDILGKENRKRITDALSRRRSYYVSKYRKRRDRRMIVNYMGTATCRKLHIGCGDNLLIGWLNSDILDINEDKIFVDARETFPFPENSFHFIYSEHLFEHLSYADGLTHLRECFRVLTTGGILRISTPNLAFLTTFYEDDTKENRNYLEWSSDHYWNLAERSKALVFNLYMKSWGHRFIYDYQLIQDRCIEAGFADVRQEDVGKSRHVELRNIESHGNVISDHWNKKESLVIEARKSD